MAVETDAPYECVAKRGLMKLLEPVLTRSAQKSIEGDYDRLSSAAGVRQHRLD